MDAQVELHKIRVMGYSEYCEQAERVRQLGLQHRIEVNSYRPNFSQSTLVLVSCDIAEKVEPEFVHTEEGCFAWDNPFVTFTLVLYRAWDTPEKMGS